MSNSTLQEYWDSLDRLKKGKPINVKTGGRITNDQVSLEAGRNRGSIKRSRPVYHELIEAIEQANTCLINPKKIEKQKLQKKKAEVDKYKNLYEESISRELSLLREVHELKQEIKKLKSLKVSSIN